MAGASEYPADGTRGIGRGGTGMARADDPTVMIRNPALLADLWGDQVMLGAHLLFVDSCFTPTGGYGWDVNRPDVSDFGEGPAWLQAPVDPNTGVARFEDADGNPLVGYADQPFPEVCYDGPAPFNPRFALTNKLSDDLGVGLAFFPPESQMLSSFSERDGTIDTPEGRRPNPLRYYTTNTNFSFFTLSAGIGYRLAPWIRLGATLQWMALSANARSWTTTISSRKPSNDIATDVFLRDLFIPGFTASVHIVPADEFDIAASFRWTEKVDAKAKLDLTAGFFGTGEPFTAYDRMNDLEPRSFGGSVPTTTNNQSGFVFLPPIYAPQLSLGLRYANRLKPRSKNRKDAMLAAAPDVEDHMATELFDLELDLIYYFTSTFDRQGFRTQTAEIEVRTFDPDGREVPAIFDVGDCSDPAAEAERGFCVDENGDPLDREVVTRFGGKNQLTVRLGGDYNIVPGIFTMRGGLSYEADGQDVEFVNLRNYMLRRIGLHAGATLRVADKSDITIGFAHFIHRDVRLQVNEESGLPPTYRTEEYNFRPGRGIPDPEGNPGNDDDFDGTAMYDLPNAQQIVGPHYLNAGSWVYNLDVLSLSFTQHF